MGEALALEPDPQREDWIDFLYWLADQPEYSKRTIILCVEKPYKFGGEYAQYLRAGGLARSR